MPQSLPLPPASAIVQTSLVLSSRQFDCLRLAAEGMASREIGQALGLSARTVDDHILLACRSLGVRTRVQAVARLVREERRQEESRSFLP